ncbi:MAG: sigma-70 family RNA polymerase sigma factor [Bacteroidales bacterium]|nr:sigma-70 family RNA polymerase sigma factor [Bacteroidales bacterium]
MEIQEFTHSAERLRSDLLLQAMHYLDGTEDAEDAVQETLVKLWIAKNRISDARKMRNMASVICRNVSLNILRDSRNSISIEDARTIASLDNPHKQLEEQESWQKLKLSVQALTDKQRAILKMRNVDNMSYTDIAKVIGTTESSIRGMISKARMALLKQMKGAGL